MTGVDEISRSIGTLIAKADANACKIADLAEMLDRHIEQSASADARITALERDISYAKGSFRGAAMLGSGVMALMVAAGGVIGWLLHAIGIGVPSH